MGVDFDNAQRAGGAPFDCATSIRVRIEPLRLCTSATTSVSRLCPCSMVSIAVDDLHAEFGPPIDIAAAEWSVGAEPLQPIFDNPPLGIFHPWVEREGLAVVCDRLLALSQL